MAMVMMMCRDVNGAWRRFIVRLRRTHTIGSFDQLRLKLHFQVDHLVSGNDCARLAT